MTADARLSTVADALERAHHASVHGSRNTRAGMLNDQGEYVRAVLSHAQEAMRSWENWEAINDAFAPGSKVIAALTSLDLHAIGAIRKALARDAILGAFRLTDPDGGARLTLCRLATWHGDPDLVARLTSRQWALDQGYRPEMADAAARDNAERIQRLKSLVSPDWAKDKSVDPELGNLREQVRPTRNQLAHALQLEPTHPPTLDAIRRLLALTLELASDAALVWIGTAVRADDFREFARKSATDFWAVAFAGAVAEWSLGQGHANSHSEP